MANLSQERQDAIVKILHYIQNGGDLETAKKMFAESFDQVDVSEITAAERALIAHGLDPRQIQYLCNVHAEVFKGNIKETQGNPDFSIPGHPVHTFKLENVVIKSLINDALLPDLHKWEQGDQAAVLRLQQEVKDLGQIKKHYKRKEMSMFPIMVKYGITAPPQVMWGVDDNILDLIKQTQTALAEAPIDQAKLTELVKKTSHEVLEMIFKEEEIMLPMIDEVASPADWGEVKRDEASVGYALIQKPMNWQPKTQTKPAQATGSLSVGNLTSLSLNFARGSLNLEELTGILALLPVQITYVDKDDKVKFFGGGSEVFPHSNSALGNDVYSCHPQWAIPKVKQILEAFRQGKKDQLEIVFKKKDQKISERFFAVKDPNGNYLGCLEVVEDVTKYVE